MAIGSTADPMFRDAFDACVVPLRKVAEYVLEPPLERRLRELGERKEFLDAQEHEELLGLVDFARRRTLDALEARVALQRLESIAAAPETP